MQLCFEKERAIYSIFTKLQRLSNTFFKMKNILILLIACTLTINASGKGQKDSWIRINQLGYRNNDIKVAVFLSTKPVTLKSFRVVDAKSGRTVMTSNEITQKEPPEPFKACLRLDFSKIKNKGQYLISAGDTESPAFIIGESVYDDAADFLLNYMRQQRCGFNPWLKDSCHTNDGYVVYGKNNDQKHIDATGGWHDAADYLQYVATSANATYQMLFAWSKNPAAFGDNFQANGLQGSDRLPDVINEARWGLDWLIKMNPSPGVMYNQIADDRDHVGFRFPNKDTANYGKGKERPVYLCTGEPQGLFRYKNRATGIASTAGKFASAFAKGSEVFSRWDPAYSDLLLKKAVEAFRYGLDNPGACQTAPGTAPYFYEEDNWTDDMELAAAELFNQTRDPKYLEYAIKFGRMEKVTPWMGSDTAKHYQWYPFINMGHPLLAKNEKKQNLSEFAGFMKDGLNRIATHAKNNPFGIGVPFIWCSNNLVAATLTQARLYSEITGDSSFAYLEAAHRDWLFGCNPWGTSMIVGLPDKGDYPSDSHSSYVLKGEQVPGGLVDGPVYPSIFASLKYIYLAKGDEYSQFQTKMAVYHDDFADYSTNECTMDGTASLVYFLSSLHSGKKSIPGNPNVTKSQGAVVRMDTTKKEIWLCFTAHEFADGFDTIIKTLDKRKIKASFFLTGDFCRTYGYDAIIDRLKKAGHYLGPHSDKNLLYCSWEKRDSLLVTRNEFLNDIINNRTELESHGISKEKSRIFLPPYEWYNDSISYWSRKAGLIPVNISSGTIINQDWTFPEGKPYYSTDFLLDNFFSYEKEKGLNGYILLIHPGTDSRRKDKLYLRIDSILNYLEGKNYTFHSFSEIN
jgi:peptidoglycan/xylan/chitin deacetylase (PgdA/CDA1 family)